MRWRTASEECASSPSAEAMAEVKKYLSSNTPRGVAMYLLEVTRLTVEFVHRDGVGHRLQVERLQVLDAVGQEAVLLAHDLLGHAQDGARPLIEALDQPVGVLQAVEQVALVLGSAARVLETVA